MNYIGKNLLFVIFNVLFFSSIASSQLNSVDSINKVIIRPFTPPVGAVIQDMMYTQAKIFLAPDIYNKSHNLLNYRGKDVILWFMSTNCENCIVGLEALDIIKEKYGNNIEIFAFSNDKKVNLIKKYQNRQKGFNIMYNSKIFGEMMYAGSLGYPRLFLINKEGYISKVIPEETMETDVKRVILKLINDINGERKKIQD